jgi:hypothetical protein
VVEEGGVGTEVERRRNVRSRWVRGGSREVKRSRKEDR